MHDNLDYHIKEQSKKYDKKRKREMHVKLDNKKKTSVKKNDNKRKEKTR